MAAVSGFKRRRRLEPPVPPEATLEVDGHTVHLLGTVGGFVPEADRVQDAFRHDPDVLALGVPPEDLDALEALHEEPGRAADLPELDEWTARFFELASPFGATRIPSPDLEAAYREAKGRELPIVALDLDDAAHTDAHTRRLGLRHVVRMNRQRNRLLKRTFEAPDVWDLARQWDAAENAGRLADIQREREAHMARQIRAALPGTRRVLAVVPAARMQGVLHRLQGPPPLGR